MVAPLLMLGASLLSSAMSKKSESKEIAKSDNTKSAGDTVSVTADQLVALKEGKLEIGDLLRKNQATETKEKTSGDDAGGGLLSAVGGILGSITGGLA